MAKVQGMTMSSTERPRHGRRRSKGRQVDGLLLLDKPTGLTSNAALQKVKRLFDARKAGHTGSLDPLASGLLPICFGHATKLSGYLLGADKIYRTTARWGSQTDTADADGQVLAESALKTVDRPQLEKVLAGFHGELQQIPPMYSALKKDGKRLYELAREGKEVEREPRDIRIDELEIESFDPGCPVLRVRCSKGTYIRTLVEDIARAAGTLGHVAALRRLSVLPFLEERMITMESLETAAQAGCEALDEYLLPLDDALSDWPAVKLGPSESYYLLQGHPVCAARESEVGLVRLYDETRRFLGIGEVMPDGRVAPKRLFVERGAPPEFSADSGYI
jgi:tRNA pseudouridine55 synthase